MIMNKEQETKFRELISQKWNPKSEELRHNIFFKTLFEVMDFPVAEYIDYEGYCEGDYLIFIRNDINNYNKFLLGKFGYGSCSGCDSIYAATTIDEIVQLAKDLLFNLKEVEYCTFDILLDLLGVKGSN